MTNTNNLMIVLFFSALLLGGCVGAIYSPLKEEVVVEKVITNDVIKEVEVVKVVEVIAEAETIVLEDAVAEVINYLDDEDLLICDLDEYDIDEVSVSKIYDEYSIDYDEDEQTITLSIKVKFDEDDEKSCRDIIDAEVYYEVGEDAEVTIL